VYPATVGGSSQHLSIEATRANQRIMIQYRSLDEASLQNCWLTIGVFDGVHRGHRELIRRLTEGAHAENALAVVLTFDPHPAVILGGRDIRCLTTPEERTGLLGGLGVDVVITEPFTKQLADVAALEFARRMKARLGFRRLLIGYDFALGRDREGNAARLASIGRELDYGVDVVAAFGDESGVFSSTEIRKLVSLGHVAEAAKLLGHPYSLSGTVVHGDGRGRRINIPTANLDYPRQKVIPSNGIYACWAWLGAERVRAAVNIGINPTFTPDKQTSSVEAHLLDLDRVLYGQDVKLDFVARLRDELRFASVPALLEQIGRDILEVRTILRAA
jgi:riboflavin kinase/FMN adenylyltransferase